MSADVSPLPPQWTEHTAPNGRQYYFNTVTKVASWKRPTATDEPLPAASSSLSAGWTQLKDKLTKDTSPVQQGTKGSTPPSAKTDNAQPSPVSSRPTPSLPAGWKQLTDDKGKEYYFNVQTRETSWTRPSDEQTPQAQGNSAGQSTPVQQGTKGSTPPAVESKLQNGPGASSVASLSAGSSVAAGAGVSLSPAKTELAQPSPVSPRPTGSSSLPAGWKQLTDDKGRDYYYNKETKALTWKRPSDEVPAKPNDASTAAKVPDVRGAGAPAENAGATTASTSAPLQKPLVDQPISPWNMKTDYRTGQQMWVNTNTGEVSWSDPNSVQAELTLPISAETLFCFGGNERPSRQELLEAGYTSGPLSTVEMFDGKMWSTLQNSSADVHRHKNTRQLSRPPLPVDFESVTSIRIGRSSCLLFGFVRVVISMETMSEVRHPSCLQWSSDTLDVIVRSDLTSVLLRQHGSSFAGVPNAVVATGGFVDDTMKAVSTDAWLCDVRNSSCNILPPLNFARANHAMAIVDLSNKERLLWFAFVFGGFDGERKSARVERYCLGANRWEVMSDMPQCRTGHCAVTVDRMIFVIGGRGRYKVLNDVDMMHVQSDSWKQVKPMNQPRANFSAVYLSPFVIVVGGWDGANFLNTVEAYDPRIDVWRKVCSLPRPKQHMGMVVMRKVQDDSTNAEEQSL